MNELCYILSFFYYVIPIICVPFVLTSMLLSHVSRGRNRLPQEMSIFLTMAYVSLAFLLFGLFASTCRTKDAVRYLEQDYQMSAKTYDKDLRAAKLSVIIRSRDKIIQDGNLIGLGVNWYTEGKECMFYGVYINRTLFHSGILSWIMCLVATIFIHRKTLIASVR